MKSVRRIGVRTVVYAAAIVAVWAGCSGRQNTGITARAGDPPPPIILDGSLLNDPAFLASLPAPCPTATNGPNGPQCSDGCRMVAGACRRVQGVIGPIEVNGDGGAGVIVQPEGR